MQSLYLTLGSRIGDKRDGFGSHGILCVDYGGQSVVEGLHLETKNAALCTVTKDVDFLHYGTESLSCRVHTFEVKSAVGLRAAVF